MLTDNCQAEQHDASLERDSWRSLPTDTV